MINQKTKMMVMAALMAAMCFVATKIIQVPTPTNGYVHLGDGFVLLSGILLGPLYGGLAAGIGSAMTDLLSGYGQYVIATFIIKGLVAVCAGFICKRVIKIKYSRIVLTVAAGIVGTLIVVGGYWAFEAFLLGLGMVPAAAGISGNIVQGLMGCTIATLLVPVFDKIGLTREIKFGGVGERAK